jgi:hypothetical protein
MEGKKIEKVLELGEGNVLLKMDDDTYVSAKIIDPEIPADVVAEFFEAGAPKEKPVKEKKTKKEPEEETADDELTYAELQDMERKALKKLIKEKDLLTDPDDFEDDDDGLRKAIAEELDIEVPEDTAEGDSDPDTDDDDYTWDDLKEMDFDDLSELCKESDLDTDPDDFEEGDEDSEEKFRRAIAKECGIEIPEKKKKKK